MLKETAIFLALAAIVATTLVTIYLPAYADMVDLRRTDRKSYHGLTGCSGTCNSHEEQYNCWE